MRADAHIPINYSLELITAWKCRLFFTMSLALYRRKAYLYRQRREAVPFN